MDFPATRKNELDEDIQRMLHKDNEGGGSWVENTSSVVSRYC